MLDHPDNMGREELFTQWYDTYATAVLRMCYLYLGNRAEAEDATQDTFVKAWRHMDRMRVQNERSVKAWLMQIAVNTCRDRFRSAVWIHTDRSVQADDVLLYKAAPKEDIDLLLDVKALPEKLKPVVLLYYYQRMTVEDIAVTLNVSGSTVSRRLSKAERLLKETEE